MDISRVDPAGVGLELAELLVAVDGASMAAAGLPIPTEPGPSRMTSLHYGNGGRPLDALWVAGSLEAPLAWATLELPTRDNLGAAMVRGVVRPEHRRAGIGRELLRAATGLARERGRTALHAGAWEGTDGVGFLEAQGFSSTGQQRYTVRRLDLHEDLARVERLRAEAAAGAADYELVRLREPAPDDLVPGLVALHEAINDAPADAGQEPDVWDAARVREYDAAMARRHQTTYRVLARHLPSGAWAGMTLLCVDEFAPSVAFQEDTNVVRAHRGHRLGLLLKCDLQQWIAAERPEVGSTQTWNATDNHHMIAVNERLGCEVVAHHVGFRRAV